MAAERVPLILVSLCLLLPIRSLAQNCDLPDFDIIEPLLESGIEGVIEDFGISVDVNVSLSRFNFTCLTTAETRGQYQFATALVKFTYTGVLAFGSCQQGSDCFALLNIECDDRNDQWIVNPLLISLSVRVIENFNGSFNIEPRLDCGSCNEALAFPSVLHDPLTNCFQCNSECLGIGLSQCTELTTTSCCSFVENGMCVSNCSTKRVLHEEFNCVCPNNFQEPDCTVCGQRCVFGAPNADCSGCNCAPGYGGDTCSDNINDCEGIICTNGDCVDLVNNFTCNCSDGFEGKFCDENINDCKGVDCNNGTCIDGINSFQCNCLTDFTGERCDTQINYCLPNPCFNGGNCIDGMDNFTCQCLPNFSGDRCEVCDLANCEICSQNESMVCLSCEEEFARSAGECVEPCSLIQCQNGGTCSSSRGVAKCSCVDGFEGNFCETDIDDCSPDPCQNRGMCIDDINTFMCRCPPDFTGLLCDIQIDNCTQNACQNNGICVDGINSFSCNCTSNFGGNLCQTCQIENCQECSQEEGLCITCNPTFLPGLQGCVVDFGAVCAENPNPAQCRFESASNQYNSIASACLLDTTDPPTIPDGATAEETVNINLGYYRSQNNNWLDRARELSILRTTDGGTGSEAGGFQDDSLNDWRELIQLWKQSIEDWTLYYQTLGFTAIPGCPEVDIDSGDPEQVYRELIDHWSTITQRFSEQASGTLCNSIG